MDFKKITNIVGKILVFLSFGFLYFLVKDLDFSHILEKFEPIWVFYVAVLSIIFSLIYIFLANAWKILLELSSLKKLDLQVLSVYLKTVIFKYIPGNVFHFLGRHSLSKSHNLTHKQIAFANGAEILLQLFSVSIIILLGVVIFGYDLKVTEKYQLSSNKLILAFLLLIAISLVVLFKKKYRELLLSKEGVFILLKVWINQTLFLLMSASILALVYTLFFDLSFNMNSFINLVFISSIAWLLGFVVPGAPGGIGIRESILLLLLAPALMISKEITLAGALIYRIITISGEVLTLFWSKIISKST